jgi:hypothetical protein
LPSMRPETRRELLELFAPENERLERFLGRSLPDWTR